MSRLDAEVTKVMYIGCPDEHGNRGKVFHLAGPNAGDEGVVLGQDAKGMYFAPGMVLSSSSARQDGATPLRSVREPRDGTATIHVGGDTARQFLANNESWWRNWSFDRDGFWCYYTEFAGWWYVPVRLTDDPEPTTGVDPQWDYFESYSLAMTGFDPGYRAVQELFTWTNDLGLNEGSLLIPNRGSMKLWPRYTMNGPGTYYIEDPLSTEEEIRVVQTPKLLAGETLRIDTFERRQTAKLYSPSMGIDGRNVWAQLKGRRWLFPILPSDNGEPTEIRVLVEGGTTDSHVTASITQRRSRPF